MHQTVNKNMCPPVLFLIFNRPSATAAVFTAICDARPSKLYIASDGPRRDHSGEERLVMEAREISMRVDWPCEVKTLFRDDNLGCKQAVSSAITWFFSQEPEGIVIEDDCQPHPDFFRYCTELLDRYRHDTRVGVICGTNTINIYKNVEIKDSYYFSRNISVWGWASWSRVWSFYDCELTSLPEAKAERIFEKLFSKSTARYLTKLFDSVFNKEIDTWDYQLSYSLFCQSRLNIIPSKNLIKNIGFNDAATHTKSKYSLEASNDFNQIDFPLRHPQFMVQNTYFDDTMNMIYTSKAQRWSRIIFKLLRL